MQKYRTNSQHKGGGGVIDFNTITIDVLVYPTSQTCSVIVSVSKIRRLYTNLMFLTFWYDKSINTFQFCTSRSQNLMLKKVRKEIFVSYEFAEPCLKMNSFDFKWSKCFLNGNVEFTIK